MRQLRLVALSDDGAHLILSDGGEEQLVLQVDERLHAAIRGDRARLGQLEIQLESQLRPRDIQARIRSGESVDSVAALSGMPLDKVERFAGPVLAERQHIADRARQATVRRLQGEGKPPTLDSVASDSARAHGIDPATIVWDAWRRDDGRWIVRCSWTVENDDIFATFSFEPTGRSAAPEDDAARILAGEIVAPVPEPEPVRAVIDPVPASKPRPSFPPESRAPVQPTDFADDGPDNDPYDDPHDYSHGDFHGDPQRDSRGNPYGNSDGNSSRDSAEAPAGPLTGPARLSVVQGARSEAPPAAPPAAPDVDERPAAAGDDVRRSSRRSTPYGRNDRRRRHTEPWDNEPTRVDDEATSERLRLSDIASKVEVEEPATAEIEPVVDTTPPEPPAEPATSAARAEPVQTQERPAPAEPDEAAETSGKKPAAKRKNKNKRPSVPSWDEIMFGRGNPE